MRGYLLLSEGRSGSNWLGSLANKTQKMGVLEEWLGSEFHDKPIRTFQPDEFFDTAIAKGTTENGRFAVKIFPRHLHRVQLDLGFDFIERCVETHPTRLVVLKRKDTFAQAVSLAKSVQTRQWTSKHEPVTEPYYDFGALCRAYFYIHRNYDYWDAYLTLKGYEYDSFLYEDLVADQSPYLDNLLAHLEVSHEEGFKSDLRVQRDELSAEWLSRFKQDLKSENVLEHCERIGSVRHYAKPRKTPQKRGGWRRIFRVG